MTNPRNMTDAEVRRLRWRCRRGLLELDIVLQRFSDDHLADLTKQELLVFDGLLDLPDNDFLDLVISRKNIADVKTLKVEQLDANAIQTVISKLSSH